MAFNGHAPDRECSQPYSFVINMCDYLYGDINGDVIPYGLDVVYGVNYLKGGSAPPYSYDCPRHGILYVTIDFNGSFPTNGSDITFFVRYLKLEVPSLLYYQDCPPAGMVPLALAVEPVRVPVLKAPVKGKTSSSEQSPCDQYAREGLIILVCPYLLGHY